MPARPCWVLTASQFAFPQALLYILRFVCSLAILLSCSCFLPALASSAQRLALAALREPDTGWGYVKASWWASLGVINRLVSQGLMESAKWFIAFASLHDYCSKT